MKTEIKILDKTQPNELLKIAPFRQHVRKTNPHKHNSYFEIIFLTKGTGSHTIDLLQFDIQPPVVFLVRKEQVHHWDITSTPEGYVLILKKNLIDNLLDKGIKQLLSKVSEFSCLFPKDAPGLNMVFQLLHREYQENANLDRHITEGLIKTLLAKLLQSDKQRETATLKKNNIFDQYIELLTNSAQLTNSVSHFAAQLHITPQNLNAVCRKVQNQSAAQVLAVFIIEEAKRLLWYSNLSVSEIAHSLNFKDDSHFIKYFKIRTGQTPGNFRVSAS